MDILNRLTITRKNLCSGVISLTITVGFLLGMTTAFADSPTAMAPPLALTSSTNSDSVFNWREIPVNDEVTIKRAVFDQGGYQLYDTVGETIVVPFTNQNLYVMKFAQTNGSRMYFVNDGDYPILYVPENGYLENATVDGARWYPFGKEFHPGHPVFLGIASSWHVFIEMGWYPHMRCYGGYWSEHPYIVGRFFEPEFSLIIIIGGHDYHSWEDYHHYERERHPPYRIGYYDPNVYRWAGRSHDEMHRFGGDNHEYYAHRPFEGSDRGRRDANRGDFVYGHHDNNTHVFRGSENGGRISNDHGRDSVDRVSHGSRSSDNHDVSNGSHDSGGHSDRVFRGSQDAGGHGSDNRSASRDSSDHGSGIFNGGSHGSSDNRATHESRVSRDSGSSDRVSHGSSDSSRSRDTSDKGSDHSNRDASPSDQSDRGSIGGGDRTSRNDGGSDRSYRR